MNFEKTIIISNYDGGYNQTIWIDGKEVYSRENGENHPLKDKIDDGYLSEIEIKSIMQEYKRSILICEDGGIEFYPYNEQ